MVEEYGVTTVPMVLIWVVLQLLTICIFLSEKQSEELETSQYESDEDDHVNDRIAKIREAEAQENLRIKTAAF